MTTIRRFTLLFAAATGLAAAAPSNLIFMKTRRIATVFAALFLSLGTADARTWKNSDGTKTFEGELKAYSAETGKATITLANGKDLTFTQDKLSEDDIAFLKEKGTIAPPAPAGAATAPAGDVAADVAAQLASQKIGAKVSKCLVKLSGDSFKPYQMEKVPDYYFLYFSASWCGPCLMKAPKLVEQYNQEKIATNPKVEFIHVSRDRKNDRAEEWAKKEQFPWPTILPDNFELCGLQEYAGKSVPRIVVVDKDGKVLKLVMSEVLDMVKKAKK